MGCLRDITDKIYALDDKGKMEKANDLYYKSAQMLKNHNPQAYEQLVREAENIFYDIDEEKAVMIVRKMIPFGERWNYETIRQFIATKGITDKCIDYYLAMNMAYNDYYEVAAKYGNDNEDYYFDIARAFVDDKDAVPNKVAKYFMLT